MPGNNNGDIDMVAIQCEGLENILLILERQGNIDQASHVRTMIGRCKTKTKHSIKTANIGPPFWIRGMNFASAITRWTAAGMPRRTQAEIEERLAICQSCPELVNDRCRQCGCACIETNQVMNKLALSTEACPLGKWK